MISNRGRDSLRAAFEKAIGTRLLQRPGADTLDIKPFSADELIRTAPDAVLITISALRFRLLVIVALHDSEAASRYFGGGDETGAEAAFAETVNLVCGLLGAQLQQAFPDLGMSTPSKLPRLSLPFMTALQPQLLECYRVHINQAVQLSAAMCVLDGENLDFHLDVRSEEAECSGELELF